jgi:hypothetical protein
MAPRNWTEFTTALAMYARQRLSTVDRGTVMIRCTGDGSLIAGVFGNDNYARDDRSRREATLVRRRLREMSAEELGFAISPDGHTWAVLVQSSQHPYQTEAAKVFQMEMLKNCLEDMVQGAWKSACDKGKG